MIESIGIEFLRESPIFWGFVVFAAYFMLREISYYEKRS
jgi:hypothetical protein